MSKEQNRIDREYDVCVIGSGLAGLTVALGLAKRFRVALFSKDDVDESNTRYAQGGIAAVVGHGDSFEKHIQDTMNAGAGLCDRRIVELCVRKGPEAIKRLMEYGVAFDLGATGDFELGKEGGHSHRRILHVGDATGSAIIAPLIRAAISSPAIDMYANHTVFQLVTQEQEVVGVDALDKEGRVQRVIAGHTVLASGGCGQVFSRTTNPAVATGDGLVLARNAGAILKHLEFYQFHPTCLALRGVPQFLISEALRGEGGRLLDGDGNRFMSKYDPRLELAPRDIVSRAIHAEMTQSGGEPVLLDMTHMTANQLKDRFPSIFAFCLRHGINMAESPIPVSPAAHYLCGGVAVDEWGRTSIKRLSAVGEVACTGLHGANRLASNSLLEAVVFAENLVDEIKRNFARLPMEIKAGDAVFPEFTSLDVDMRKSLEDYTQRLKEMMWTYVSIERNEDGLMEVHAYIERFKDKLAQTCAPVVLSREVIEMRNLLTLSEQMVVSALQRRESIGLHFRTDDENSRKK